MKKFTLSGKLGIGFGAMILLITVLGGLAIWRITLAVASATNVATSHAPEVKAAYNVHDAAWKTRFFVRSYALTGNPKFLSQARERLSVLKDHLTAAATLAESSPDLVELTKGEEEASLKTTEFEGLLDQLEEAYKAVAAQDATLDTAAAMFLQNCTELRIAQQRLITAELEGTPDATKLKDRLVKIRLIEDYIDEANAIRIATCKAKSAGNAEAEDEVMNLFTPFNDTADQLKSLLLDQSADLEPLAKAREAAANYRTAVEKAMRGRASIAEITTNLAATADVVTNKAGAVTDSGLRSITAAATDVADGLDLARLILLVGSGIALIVGTLIATVSARSITIPIRRGISALATTASQLSVTISQLAASASETAAAVAETTTTLDEVRQTAQVAADKAKAVADNAKGAAIAAETGRKATVQTTLGLTLIRSQMDAIGENITRLSEQSQAVGDIVATVGDLAEQSNLLAVNASIEAAKAGEMGKGFAVVAQEIRNLAEQSKDSTRQVRGILAEVQKATSKAVTASDQGVRIVADGNQQANEAGQAIAALTATVQDSTRAAVQIATSSQQQLVGMDQVGRAMENIKTATMQNAEGARQLGAAALSLQEIGARLQELVTGSATDLNATR